MVAGLWQDMPMGQNHRKPPRDANQLAEFVVNLATGQREDRKAKPEQVGKAAHAAELGRIGGQKGGEARAKALSPERRKEIARRAAAARWNE